MRRFDTRTGNSHITALPDCAGRPQFIPCKQAPQPPHRKSELASIVRMIFSARAVYAGGGGAHGRDRRRQRQRPDRRGAAAQVTSLAHNGCVPEAGLTVNTCVQRLGDTIYLQFNIQHRRICVATFTLWSSPPSPFHHHNTAQGPLGSKGRLPRSAGVCRRTRAAGVDDEGHRAAVHAVRRPVPRLHRQHALMPACSQARLALARAGVAELQSARPQDHDVNGSVGMCTSPPPGQCRQQLMALTVCQVGMLPEPCCQPWAVLTRAHVTRRLNPWGWPEN